MEKTPTFLVIAAAVALSGCNTIPGAQTSIPVGPIPAASVVPLPLVLNRLKCDMAAYLVFQANDPAKRLKAKSLKGTLTFNLNRSLVDKGGLGIAVAPAGIKVSAGATAMTTSHENYKQTLTISMDLSDTPSVSCTDAKAMLPVPVIDLVSLATQVNESAAGEPKISISQVDFEGEFYLQQQEGVTGGIDVVVFKIADTGETRTGEYVQSFKLTADTVGSVPWKFVLPAGSINVPDVPTSTGK